VIKARLATPGGRPILIFGLSDENIRRLQAGDPIKFELGDLGIKPSIPVVIMAGPGRGRDAGPARRVV
jgi:hypothetical protein